MGQRWTPTSRSADFDIFVQAWPVMRQAFAIFLRVCNVVSPICLWLASALLLWVLAFLANERTEWVWLRHAVKIAAILLAVGYSLLIVIRARLLGIGWLGVFLGILLLCSPLLLALLARHVGLPSRDELLRYMVTSFPPVGTYLAFVSVLHLMIGYPVQYFLKQKSQMEQFNLEGKQRHIAPSFIPRCWEMYACRDALRPICPNYIEHIPCWKRRKGCLCDRELANVWQQQLKMAEGTGDGPLDLSPSTQARSYTARFQHTPPRPWRQQRRLCFACPVFLEHQAIKYRNLSWIFLPITLTAVVYLYPYYHAGYDLLARYLQRFSEWMVKTGQLPPGFHPDASTLVDSPFEYLLLVSLTMLLMSYIVEFMDYCLLELKL